MVIYNVSSPVINGILIKIIKHYYVNFSVILSDFNKRILIDGQMVAVKLTNSSIISCAHQRTVTQFYYFIIFYLIKSMRRKVGEFYGVHKTSTRLVGSKFRVVTVQLVKNFFLKLKLNVLFPLTLKPSPYPSSEPPLSFFTLFKTILFRKMVQTKIIKGYQTLKP